MNKIRIEDLSVGDWVQDKKGSIAQIIGIENWSDGYVLNVRINGIDVGCVSANAIEPIPLTQEILEKNGFEENCGRWYNSEALMEFELYKDSWCRTINCGEYSAYSIKYVHELQHALRLAKSQREIIL